MLLLHYKLYMYVTPRAPRHMYMYVWTTCAVCTTTNLLYQSRSTSSLDTLLSSSKI